MGFSEFVVKYVLFIVNLFFLLLGIVVVGIGAAMYADYGSVAKVAEGLMLMSPRPALILGAGIFFISFYGCCGAIRESYCMLLTYAALLVVLMCGNIATAYTMFVLKNQLLEHIPEILNDIFKNTRDLFSDIEKTFRCCGTKGSFVYGSYELPPSCCAPIASVCNIVGAVDRKGCEGEVYVFFKTFGELIGYSAIIAACFQMVATVFTLCFANYIHHNRHRMKCSNQ